VNTLLSTFSRKAQQRTALASIWPVIEYCFYLAKQCLQAFPVQQLMSNNRGKHCARSESPPAVDFCFGLAEVCLLSVQGNHPVEHYNNLALMS